MSEKNILFVASHFPPAAGPAGQRPAKFCKYLPEFGYRPLVLAVSDRKTLHPADHTLLNDVRETTIYRCGTFKPWPIRALRLFGIENLLRALFFASPDIGALTWHRDAISEARRIFSLHRIDAIYATVGPFSNAILGLKLKRLLGGIPLVLDYRDPWTTAHKSWPTPFHLYRERSQEKQALAAADAIIAVTPTMQNMLEEAFPQSRGRVHVICNGYDRDDIPPRCASPLKGPLRVGYCGSSRRYRPQIQWALHGLLTRRFFYGEIDDYSTYTPEYLCRATRVMLDNRPELNDHIFLRFAGQTTRTYAPLVSQLRLENIVSLEGYLPHSDSIRLLNESDVLFLPYALPTNGKRNYNYSGKIFEYLAVGKPILAAAPPGDARDLVERVGAGWCVGPKDIAGMASLLTKLVEAKMSGTLAIHPDKEIIYQFERRALTSRLADVFDSLTSCRGGARP